MATWCSIAPALPSVEDWLVQVQFYQQNEHHGRYEDAPGGLPKARRDTLLATLRPHLGREARQLRQPSRIHSLVYGDIRRAGRG